MHCCTANCSRALYSVWDRMVEDNDDILQLNLILNRVTDTVVVRSYLPYEGRAVISLKKRKELKIRIPQWMDRSTLKVLNAAGHDVEHSFDKTFLSIETLPAGENVELLFELPEHEETEQVGHLTALIKYRGNEVVGFSPPGKDNPYWQNKSIDVRECPETIGSYFVPDSRFGPARSRANSLH